MSGALIALAWERCTDAQRTASIDRALALTPPDDIEVIVTTICGHDGVCTPGQECLLVGDPWGPPR